MRFQDKQQSHKQNFSNNQKEKKEKPNFAIEQSGFDPKKRKKKNTYNMVPNR